MEGIAKIEFGSLDAGPQGRKVGSEAREMRVHKGDADPGVAGQPKKRARVTDLRNNYPHLS